MDGNGRWATNRHLPRSAGHKVGAENLKELCRNCVRYGVKYLTVYAFSTENWSRPQPEVDFLMKLFVELFDKYDEELAEEGIRVRFIGDDSELPKRVREVCKTAEERSKNRPNMQLIVALNYGGRAELVHSVKAIAEKVKSGEIVVEDINEDLISQNIYTSGQPDPDIIVRPSGEYRLSNFLTWQSAYSEFWFSDILWPDFTTDDVDAVLEDYQKRHRRFGGV